LVGAPRLPSNKSLTRLPHSGGRNSLIINDLRRGGGGGERNSLVPKDLRVKEKELRALQLFHEVAEPIHPYQALPDHHGYSYPA